MNTVNVIEVLDTNNMSINRFASFEDTPEGNKEAEKLFKELLIDTAAQTDEPINPEDPDDQEYIEERLDDGYYQRGLYWLGIVHNC